MAGGYTMHLPEEDTAYISKSKLKDEMVGLLGGRVAEKLIIGDISTGANNDIDRASQIAKRMVMDYGMSDETWNNILLIQAMMKYFLEEI